MDWTVLSAQAVALLIPFLPYLQEAGKEVAKEIAGDAWEKIKLLYTSIKKKSSKDKDTSQLLSMFEKNPELFKEALAKTLASFAETDEEFGKLLTNSVDNSHDNTITQTIVGDGNIQAANGTVTINSFPLDTPDKKNRKK